jgi:hypothetical protein|eukprot:COSAG01_NODE_242_length_20582_cov_314.397256_8_plen_91_part_00
MKSCYIHHFHQVLQPWYQNVDLKYIKAFDLAYGGPRMGGNFGKPGLNLTAMNSSARVLTLLQWTVGSTCLCPHCGVDLNGPDSGKCRCRR